MRRIRLGEIKSKIPHDIKLYREIAVNAAQKAGRLLLEKQNLERKIAYKGEADLVTDADTTAEKLIVELIKDNLPEHSILAEEGSGVSSDSEYLWIIDPLDGTTNYAHHFPFFCVSIALKYIDDILLGVVYNPVFDELFLAIKGEGAYLNDKEISVSGHKDLMECLLATGFPYDKARSERDNLKYFNIFLKRIQGIRRAGSAAMDLVYTACGRLDGYWELKLKPWDMAAGALIVREAGGKVTGFDGEDLDIFKGDIIASNGLIHNEMQSTINSIDRREFNE
ncbi:MAG: inositol monophosphatase [candidate division Zixibacteria bacterium]|nr:inositol monophosphatase [candidate division Zixibacteria bacterium]